MNRISKLLKKAHGAWRPFMARLRDAFFLVSRHDVEVVESSLRAKGHSDTEIQNVKYNEWAFFLKFCRRIIPNAYELERRLQKVYDTYAGICDAKTGEPLFRAQAHKAYKNLLCHVRAGCLSDPAGVNLYFEDGYEQGIRVWRCIRGTNSLEGYHKQKRVLVSRTVASPKLLHYLLLEYNFRWNIRMAVKNRGMSPEVGAHYQQPLLDEIQRLSSELSTKGRYNSWPIAHAYHDTSERGGLAVSAHMIFIVEGGSTPDRKLNPR